MGNMGAPVLLGGGGGGLVRSFAKGNLVPVHHLAPMSASYATGGDTYILSTKIKGMRLRGVDVYASTDATRRYFWNGNLTTPKVIATSLAGTEVTAATDLSANSVYVVAYYES